jgi:hypothetical protein
MATVPKPEKDTERDTEKGLAEFIISHYNAQLRCLSCNVLRPRGAFNRDQAGRNKDNEPSRRYVCKGKALGQCGKTYSPKNVWLLARDQLGEEQLAYLMDLYPIATRGPLVSDPESQQTIDDDSTSSKRIRDPSPSGLTPPSKRFSVGVGVDHDIPPPSMHLNSQDVSSELSNRPEDLVSLSSAIYSGHVDDIERLSRLLELVKGRIAQLELETPPPFEEGESRDTYVEVARRSSHSPVPCPRSPKVLPTHRDVAAFKQDLSVIYLTFPNEMEKKVGVVRERLACGTGLRVLNVSLIGSTHVEVLVEGLDVKDWEAGVLSVGFGVPEGFDPTDPGGKGPRHGSSRASFVRRVNHEIKTSRRRRVREFYREWLQLLGWSAEAGTKSIHP